MKRSAAMILAAALVFSMAGCGESKAGTDISAVPQVTAGKRSPDSSEPYTEPASFEMTDGQEMVELLSYTDFTFTAKSEVIDEKNQTFTVYEGVLNDSVSNQRLYEKLCGFIMLVPSAFMQSMSAFVAQNVGARKMERADKSLFYGIAASFCVGVIMFWLAFFHGDLLSALFARDAEVISASADYLKSYAIDCLFTAFLFCFAGYFNGCGLTFFVMVEGIVGAFCVRIPVSFLISRMAGASLFHIGLATPASTIVQIIFCVVYFAYRKKKHPAGLQ